MATVAAVAGTDPKLKDSKGKEPVKDPLANDLIPEIFVDRRKEADGTLGEIVHRYSRGRVLGKVLLIIPMK